MVCLPVEDFRWVRYTPQRWPKRQHSYLGARQHIKFIWIKFISFFWHDISES
jgi:hypothetical protein